MSIIITKNETLCVGDIAITSRKIHGYINATQLCVEVGNYLVHIIAERKQKTF